MLFFQWIISSGKKEVLVYVLPRQALMKLGFKAAAFIHSFRGAEDAVYVYVSAPPVFTVRRCTCVSSRGEKRCPSQIDYEPFSFVLFSAK